MREPLQDVVALKASNSSVRPVLIKRLPEKLAGDDARTFFLSVEPLLRGVRPQVVFDFSRVTEIDATGVAYLLRSMQQVMKQNGDLKLARLGAGPATVLQLMKVHDLFEAFETTSEAVESFDYLAADPLSGFTPAPLANSGLIAGD